MTSVTIDKDEADLQRAAALVAEGKLLRKRVFGRRRQRAWRVRHGKDSA